MGMWSPVEMACLLAGLAGLVVWTLATGTSMRLLLAHRRDWPPEIVEHDAALPERLTAHACVAALDALRAHGRIGAAEHAAPRRDLMTEGVGRRRKAGGG